MGGCCHGSRYPSVRSMARDISATVFAALGHAARNGEILASGDETRSRIETCNGCDQKVGVRCLKCGCYINPKAAVKVSKCPIGKW